MNLSGLGEDESLQTAAAKGKAEEVQNNHSEGGELFDLNSLPPGYRFNPTDAEIIVFYLRPKLDHQSLPPNKIIEVNLYADGPDELAARYEPSGSDEWFYFTPRERKYPNGKRPKRSVGEDGYWKATGADKEIKFEDRTVGYRKDLVFCRGSFKNGVKTNWTMHEFRVAKHPESPRISGVIDMRLDDCVLCRVYRKDERIYKRSRHESWLDESGPSSSRIPRGGLLNHNPNEVYNRYEEQYSYNNIQMSFQTQQSQPRTEIFQTPQEHDHFALQSNTPQDHTRSSTLNHNPNEANNRYEEQYSYNNIQMHLQTQQPQPRTEIFQTPQEHDHFVLQSNTPQQHMRSSTLNHNPNEANNRYGEQYPYSNIQMPLQTQQPQPRTEIFQTPQERDHFALQSNTQFPTVHPSVLMLSPATPRLPIHCHGNEFGGQGLDNSDIMNGVFGSSFDGTNNSDFCNIPNSDAQDLDDWDKSIDFWQDLGDLDPSSYFGKIPAFDSTDCGNSASYPMNDYGNDTAPASSNMNGN